MIRIEEADEARKYKRVVSNFLNVLREPSDTFAVS